LSGFPQGINQKPKAIWRERFFGVHLRRLAEIFAEYRPKAGGCPELHFFESSQRVAGEAFCRGMTKSRRLPGVNVFSGHISECWQGFLQEIDQKPKAAWSCTFSGYRSRSLEKFFEKD
jgi:hypothetical protein